MKTLIVSGHRVTMVWGFLETLFLRFKKDIIFSFHGNQEF